MPSISPPSSSGATTPNAAPYSAIALHADTSAITAIVNDYGAEQAFARGVEAHGRQGDIFLAISTSGRSANVVRAAATADRLGLTVLALTGSTPNPLADAAHDVISIRGRTPTIQEVHQVVVHLICEAADRRLCRPYTARPRGGTAHDPVGRRRCVSRSGHPRRGPPTVPRCAGGGGRPTPRHRTTRWGRPRRLPRRVEHCDDVRLLAATGRDDAGMRLRHLLEAAGVELVAADTVASTVQKTRVMVDGRPLVRVDAGGAEAVGSLDWAGHDGAIEGEFDSVLVADYGLGVAETGASEDCSPACSSMASRWCGTPIRVGMRRSPAPRSSRRPGQRRP